MKKEYKRLNPYFIGLSILIMSKNIASIFNNNVSILILLDYLFLYRKMDRLESYQEGLNPYFIGLSILILE